VISISDVALRLAGQAGSAGARFLNGKQIFDINVKFVYDLYL
jgi:hypothetical protein